MEIITDPKNKILTSKTKDVEHINSEIKTLANDMFETMLNNNGVGLSANQVGYPLSLIVFTDPDYSKKYILINPKIISTSESLCTMEEGCLSLPNT
jgi:peptide deformylase